MIRDRLVVGVVTPHLAPGPEVELPAMSGGRVATAVSRTVVPPEALPSSGTEVPAEASTRTPPGAHRELRASTEPAALDGAAVHFGSRTLDAVVHASTTTGYVIGHREEADLIDRLAQRFGVPAVASCAAAVAALRTHGVERFQLVHPPWFDDEFDRLGEEYFGSQGFDAVVNRATGLPDDPAGVSPQDVVEWVEQHVDDRAEAVFLAGNGLRAAGAIRELETRTGLLVVEANQALLWGLLTATGSARGITDHGRLLKVAS